MEEIKALFPVHQTHKKYILQELTASAPPKSFCFVQMAVKPVKPIGYHTVNPRSSDRDQAIRSFIHQKKNYVGLSVSKNLNTAFT
jgi:hypothetical protein